MRRLLIWGSGLVNVFSGICHDLIPPSITLSPSPPPPPLSLVTSGANGFALETNLVRATRIACLSQESEGGAVEFMIVEPQLLNVSVRRV